MSENIQEIFTDLIDDPVVAMRSELDRNALFELADNIKQNGLINPITVRPVHDDKACPPGTPLLHGMKHTSLPCYRYEVVAGHRRLGACKIAGKIKIACVVRTLTDSEVFAIKAAENLERADIDPVDESIFISKYIEQTGRSVPEVAKVLRRSVAYVETRLAVGNMPDYMQEYIKRGELKLGAALSLVQITNDNMRRVWVDMAVRDGVSVAQAEYWLHGWLVNQLPGGVDSNEPPAGFVPGVAAPVMFECAIDGKKYDARLFRTAMIYEGNYDLFLQIAAELRKDAAPSESYPGNEATAPDQATRPTEAQNI